MSFTGTYAAENFVDIGVGLFQSDHDFDIMSELCHDAGITKMEEEAQATAKAVGRRQGRERHRPHLLHHVRQQLLRT